ncbi:MAG TPA: hypothetical protein VNX68_15685 [Nitrosopumilaceae archaeon]|jgi:hypothetical protein|nr:hypothetical protein [Nitrosopumilaceae archaeon]
MKKFYFVHRPGLEPKYNYTFADNEEEEAIHKVTMKFGDIAPYTTAREIKGDELNELVIGTAYFG